MFDFAPPPAAPPLPLQQSAIYAAGLGALGLSCLRHHLPGGSTLVLRRIWPGIGTVALISRGPVWSMRPHAGALSALRPALGVRHLIVNADGQGDALALRQAGYLRIAAPQQVAELSLQGTQADWLARMDGKWRNRLRHAQRQPLAVSRSAERPAPGHWLFRADAGQRRARGYRALPHALIFAIAALDPDAVRIFEARQGGRPVAAMLFLRHGAAATYQIGWSGAVGRAASAHNLILWNAMQCLAADGVRLIELGTGDMTRTPGLARFKAGSGAALRDLGGSWLDSGALAPVIALRRRG